MQADGVFSATYCGEPLFLPIFANSLPFDSEWTHSRRQPSYIEWAHGRNHTYIYTYKDKDIYIYGSKSGQLEKDLIVLVSLIKLYFSYIPRHNHIHTYTQQGLQGVHPTVHLLSNGRRSLTQMGELLPNEGESDDRSKRKAMRLMR
jgi:hypothetical protein